MAPTPTPTKPQHLVTSQRRRRQSTMSFIGLSPGRKQVSPILFKKILEQKRSRNSENNNDSDKRAGTALESTIETPDVRPNSNPFATAKESGAVKKTHNKRHSLTGSMGIKEMDQYVAKLQKENFDLKLELYHRREKHQALQEKADRYDQLEGDVEEMNTLIDTLQTELEKRDKALDLAAQMVVEKDEEISRLYQQLENWPTSPRKIESWNEEITPRRSSYQSPHSMSQTFGFSSPLERTRPAARRSPETTPVRMNSFQSIYDFDNADLSPASSFDLGSPSLSVLSESSFMSVYGERIEDVLQDDDFFLDRPDLLTDQIYDCTVSLEDPRTKERLQRFGHARSQSTPSMPIKSSRLRQQFLMHERSAELDRMSPLADIQEEQPEDDMLPQLSCLNAQNQITHQMPVFPKFTYPPRPHSSIVVYCDEVVSKRTPETRGTLIQHGLPTPGSSALRSQKSRLPSIRPALRLNNNKQLPTTKSSLPVLKAIPIKTNQTRYALASPVLSTGLITPTSSQPATALLTKAGVQTKSRTLEPLPKPTNGAALGHKRDLQKRYSMQLTKENKPMWK